MHSSRLSRRELLKRGFVAAAGTTLLPLGHFLQGASESFSFDPARNLIHAPKDPARWPEFHASLERWRVHLRQQLGYSDQLYIRPDFKWVTGNFCCCFLMLCDEQFYDHRRGRYRVAHFLAHGQREFGGYESVVLWHAYPRIGLDERNQFDFYRDMPGGLKGLRKAVDELHAAGVKVFIDYNPWDTGTRREPMPDVDSLCEIVRVLDADGIFLDTMDKAAAEFRAKLDAVRPGVALEGELALPVERIADHHASWAQQFDDSEVPGVLRNKWFERRHLQHQIRRWSFDHTSELHTAWMNGSGMMVWENVFGSWVGWSSRDRSLLRSMLPIQRRYQQLFCGERWTPLVPCLQPNVYASLWTGNRVRLWTLVNRSDSPVEGRLLDAQLGPEEVLFDLLVGTRCSSASGRLQGRGIACFLAASQKHLGSGLQAFLRRQREQSERANFDLTNPRTKTVLIASPSLVRAPTAPHGMVEIGAAKVELKIQMRNRECGFYDGNPPDSHKLWNSYNFAVETFTRQVVLTRYAIDLTPVTNAQFSEFLRAFRYRPAHKLNFLKHWRGGGPVPGTEEHPVVFVGLEDARAYARWAGKRLPTEEEWQYAAQGPDHRKFPWGDEMLPDRCNTGQQGGTTPVRQFPDGRSPFGVYDLCGNVWEWTESERSDSRTRFCILRGGSFFTARGSGWYMDGGPRPVDFAAKFLLMWPGVDRCATIGFRCVADLS